MKQALALFALVVIAFLAGWFGRLAYTYNPQGGLQWQFVAAAQRGDLDGVQICFLSGARIDETPSAENGVLSGFPALLQASGAGRTEVVEWLLNHGADPNQQSSDTWPLAAAEGHVVEANKTVAILKAHGARNLYP